MKLSNPFRRKQKSWVPTDQGMMNTGWDLGWWQQDLQPQRQGTNETVEACISTIAQTVAMCPVQHLSDEDNGEAKRLTGSNAERVLLNPNEYTTRSLFFNDLLRSLYFTGNGYAIATRDGNRAIKNLFVTDPRNITGVIDPESGEVYYWVSPNNWQKYNPDTDSVYPSRDVLNVRISTKAGQPLKGETPLTAAANSAKANGAIVGHQAKFFTNMLRPSGVLSTDQQLTKEQMLQLREAVAAQSRGENSGKVPILGNGLKWESMSLSSQDSQLVEAYSMTVQSISSVFRVPLPLINSMTGSTFANAEATMNWFLSSGLGFMLEHVELELNKLFNLPFKERINFNTKALLRSDWKSQIDTLGEGVIKGIYSPNEARAMLGYGAVPDGDEPRVQQQVVPLSAWDQGTVEPVAEPDIDVMASFEKGFVGAT